MLKMCRIRVRAVDRRLVMDCHAAGGQCAEFRFGQNEERLPRQTHSALRWAGCVARTGLMNAIDVASAGLHVDMPLPNVCGALRDVRP